MTIPCHELVDCGSHQIAVTSFRSTSFIHPDTFRISIEKSMSHAPPIQKSQESRPSRSSFNMSALVITLVVVAALLLMFVIGDALLLFPAVTSAREAVRETDAASRCRRVVLDVRMCHDSYGRLPKKVTCQVPSLFFNCKPAWKEPDRCHPSASDIRSTANGWRNSGATPPSATWSTWIAIKSV